MNGNAGRSLSTQGCAAQREMHVRYVAMVTHLRYDDETLAVLESVRLTGGGGAVL